MKLSRRATLKAFLGIGAGAVTSAQASPLVPVINYLLDDEACQPTEDVLPIITSDYLGSDAVQRVGFRDYFLPARYRSGDSGVVVGYVERILSARGVLRVRVYTEHGMNISDSDYQAFDQIITLAEGQWYGRFEIKINEHNRVGTGEILLRMEVVNSLSSLDTSLDCPNAEWGGIYLFDSQNRVPVGTTYVSTTQAFLDALNNPAVNYIGVATDIQQPDVFMTAGGTSLQDRKVVFGANQNTARYDSARTLGDSVAGNAIYDGKFLSFESLRVEKIRQDNNPADNFEVYATQFIGVTGLRIVYPAGANSSPVYLCKKGGRVFNCVLDTHISSENDFRNAGAIHGYHYSETVIEACDLTGQLYNKSSLSASDKGVTVKRCRIVPPDGILPVQIESANNGKTHHGLILDRVLIDGSISVGAAANPAGVPFSEQGGGYEIRNCVIGGTVVAAWKQGYRLLNCLSVGTEPLWRFYYDSATVHDFWSNFNVIAAGKTVIANDARYAANYNTGYATKDYLTLAELQQAGFDPDSVVVSDFGVIDDSNSNWLQRNYQPTPDSPLLNSVGHDGYKPGIVHSIGQKQIGATKITQLEPLLTLDC